MYLKDVDLLKFNEIHREAIEVATVSNYRFLHHLLDNLVGNKVGAYNPEDYYLENEEEILQYVRNLKKISKLKLLGK